MNPLLQSLIARGKEPSTWSAVSAGLAGLGFSLPAGWVQTITYLGMGLCCLAGILLPEKKAA